MNKQNKKIPRPISSPPNHKPSLSTGDKLNTLEKMLENAPNDKLKQAIEQQIIELKNLLNNE